jgi:hypothetical protein
MAPNLTRATGTGNRTRRSPNPNPNPNTDPDRNLSFASPIDHTVFRSFDCGFIVRGNISLALNGLISETPNPNSDAFLSSITHGGAEDFTDRFNYPELVQYRTDGSPSPYNSFLHVLIHEHWGDTPIHVTMTVTYKTVPTCGCPYPRYELTVFFNKMLAYRQCKHIKMDYMTKGPIFIANDLQRRYLASVPVPM